MKSATGKAALGIITLGSKKILLSLGRVVNLFNR